MDTIKKNGKTIAIVAGAAAVIAGIYVLFKKSKEDDVDQVQIVDETGSSLTVADKNAILTGIKIEYQGENLTIATIGQICDVTLKFAAPQFVELTRRDRTERRRNRHDLQRYIDLWDEYATNLEEVIEGSQREVLKELGVPDNVWENSNSFYMQQGNHELLMLHASLPQKLKMSLGASKNLSPEEFKKVLRAQVDYLNQEADNAASISSKIKRPEEIAPVVQNRVNDRIFEDFGVEEEDIFVSMRQSMMDPEVQQIFMQLQQATMRLMPMNNGGGYY